MNEFRVALCQMYVEDNKKKNLNKAVQMIEEAAKNNARLAVLPEMFNCPYDISKFESYAEEGNKGETLSCISQTAKKYGINIIAGTIPEYDEGKLYNSSYVFSSKGLLIAKHRKAHLFDIEIPGKIVFKESDVLAAGSSITVVDTELCRIGIAVCYDIRFPEFIRLMALSGAKLIVVPGAFNTVTGPAHWELLIRSRALDNQVYVAAVSPARNEKASYIVYGFSMAADPWGKVIASANTGEKIVYVDIRDKVIEQVRSEIPVFNHRRLDLYEICQK